jgi:hypothetical protein
MPSYKPLIAVQAALILAGCGVQPVPIARNITPDARVDALVDTTRHRKSLVVPADVMAYVDDYVERMRDKYGKDVSFGVTLVASNDDFKRRFEARLEGKRGKGSQGFLLPEDAPAGELAYYLVVNASVVKEKKNGLSVDALDPFYVSDYGKNYVAKAR